MPDLTAFGGNISLCTKTGRMTRHASRRRHSGKSQEATFQARSLEDQYHAQQISRRHRQRACSWSANYTPRTDQPGKPPAHFGLKGTIELFEARQKLMIAIPPFRTRQGCSVVQRGIGRKGEGPSYLFARTKNQRVSIDTVIDSIDKARNP